MKLSVIFLFCLIFLLPLSSQAMLEKEHERGPTIGRAAFYAGMARGGEWLVSGLFLNNLDRIGASRGRTILGISLRGQFFMDNKKIIEQCGRYVGLTAGTWVGIAVVDYVLPAGKHLSGCWKRCCESIWEWDSAKSSKRDKVVTMLSAGLGAVSLYYGEHILSVLFGKKWKELLWK